LNYLNASLKNILINFGCQVQKGVFPHKFMNKDTLNYVGEKPDYNFFDNGKLNSNGQPEFSIDEYNLIPNDN
jgi:hypothetical protein